MKRRVALAGCVLLAIGMAGWRWPWQKKKPTIRAYIVHHAEGAFKTLNRAFERQTGIHVDAAYACRRNMYHIVSKNRDGDIYVTSAPANLEKAKKDGLASEPIIAIGELLPVIEVIKGNPKGIKTLADLAKPGVRVVLGGERACMGRVAARILAKNRLTDTIAPNVVARVRGEQNIAKAVDGKAADATIVWLSTVRDIGSRTVETLAIPPEHNVIEPISTVLLDTGKNKEAARKFALFLQGGKARKILREAGLLRTN